MFSWCTVHRNSSGVKTFANSKKKTSRWPSLLPLLLFLQRPSDGLAHAHARISSVSRTRLPVFCLGNRAGRNVKPVRCCDGVQVLKQLLKVVQGEGDAQSLAVACHDVGCFIQYFPAGKGIVTGVSTHLICYLSLGLSMSWYVSGKLTAFEGLPAPSDFFCRQDTFFWAQMIS